MERPPTDFRYNPGQTRPAAMGLGNLRVKSHRKPRQSGLDDVCQACRTTVQDRLDLAPGIGEGEGCAIGVIVAGGDHRLAAGHHAIAVDIGPHGLGQHDARPVITGKGQGPLNGPGRQHHPFGAHPPKALRGLAVQRRLSRLHQFLRQSDQVMVPVTNCGGSCQNPHASCGQGLQSLCDPGLFGFAVSQQPAARDEVLLHQHHPLASRRSVQRRC